MNLTPTSDTFSRSKNIVICYSSGSNLGGLQAILSDIIVIFLRLYKRMQDGILKEVQALFTNLLLIFHGELGISFDAVYVLQFKQRR
jgi:hypothetical protein